MGPRPDPARLISIDFRPYQARKCRVKLCKRNLYVHEGFSDFPDVRKFKFRQEKQGIDIGQAFVKQPRSPDLKIGTISKTFLPVGTIPYSMDVAQMHVSGVTIKELISLTKEALISS